MEVIKNKQQVGKGRGMSTLSFVKQLYQIDGFLGFYKGYFVSLGAFVPHTLTYFIIYEQLKKRASIHHNSSSPVPIHYYSLSAASSSACACVVSDNM